MPFSFNPVNWFSSTPPANPSGTAANPPVQTSQPGVGAGQSTVTSAADPNANPPASTKAWYEAAWDTVWGGLCTAAKTVWDFITGIPKWFGSTSTP